MRKRKLPIERAVKLSLEICDALDYMHKHGVVHRDLKPENIMVCEGDRIKLIDFGIAMKEDARRLTFTDMSSVLGTPDYISPEQVKGQRGDQRSDIYALGAMLYEMLTGQPPFTGPNPLAVMNERLLIDPKPVRELNAEISPEIEEDSFPRPRARPAPPLRDGRRDGLGTGAPGAGGRRWRIGAWPCARPAAQHAQVAALRGARADARGAVRRDAAAGEAVKQLSAFSSQPSASSRAIGPVS